MRYERIGEERGGRKGKELNKYTPRGVKRAVFSSSSYYR
jgi:hypothetical protein